MIDGVWGEAVAAWKSGETCQLSADDEKRLRDRILPKFQVVDLMEEMIDALFDHVPVEYEEKNHNFFLQTIDILNTLETAGYKRKGNKSDAMDLARCMKNLGFEKGHIGNLRGYRGIVKRE